MGASGAERRLPVPVTPFGPMFSLGLRVHDLNTKGRSWEALHAADAYEMIVRLAGDDKTAWLIMQGRMYAYQSLGRWEEALLTGERLLERHRTAGDAASEAKTLADLADTLFRLSRLDEALHCLALAGVLLERTDRRHARYVSALSSMAEAARQLELYEMARDAARSLVEITPDAPEPMELERAEMYVEWGLRLDHIGRGDEAATRFAQGAALARTWVDRLAELGPEAESPWAKALLALALAKLGDIDEALRIAAPTVLRTRERGQHYEARLAHLAYGVALRARGDPVAARREFVAAIELSAEPGRTNTQMIFQYELAVLAAAECPEPAAGELLAALRGQAERHWRLRLERTAMLRQARRRIELEDARARADSEAQQDPLTGLGNRRAFDRQMAAIDTADAWGAANPLVLLLLDLDLFKSVNDTYSHGVGDQVLAEVAGILRANCRQEDVPVRLGGDEFAVFLRASLPVAAKVAERIRRCVAGRDWNEIAFGLRVTASIGLAALRPGVTGAQLFDAADGQLYVAKRSGRNQLAA